MVESTKLILALMKIKGVGSKTIINALESFAPDDIKSDFNFVKTLQIKKVQSMIDSGNLDAVVWRQTLESATDMIQKHRQLDIEIIDFLMPDYPQNLKQVETKKFPAVLYVKGNLLLLNAEKSIAVIGTRDPTDNGLALTEKYIGSLVDDGFVVVSGLALGTDTNAHVSTLENSGKTVAILAAGLDEPVYPAKNRELAEKILTEGGALVSEYPAGTKLMPQYLAARDEWQSGMSDGVLAIETGVKGGTQIAMGHSGRQGRPLAVPDYRRYEGDDYIANTKQAQGTDAAIQANQAFPLYTRGSVKQFITMMIEQHQKRVELNRKVEQPPVKVHQPEQTQANLF
ncbi:DNA-processing protein DprA [Weissella sp. DD23]|nr:DNA-processing protein DprA [Weissella sp. DD23]MCT0011654.1 DNA-processing protein DprA [Weissella cibaria]MCT0951630.1 DNA-processing protein DprA [Weissella cibaria]MCU7538963.1 DNA-processing protein DprA [Weissella cibaria]TVV31460.1 DNA-processing protein DprA [Weissella cibaria]